MYAPSKDFLNLPFYTPFLFSRWQERLAKCQNWARPTRSSTLICACNKHGNWGQETGRGEGTPPCSQAWLQQTGWTSCLPDSMPVLFPLQLTKYYHPPTAMLRDMQKKKKAQSVAEILASLKQWWLHSAAAQVPAKAGFLYSIRRGTGRRSSWEILRGSIC